MLADIYKNSQVAAYQPPDEVAKFTSVAKKEFTLGTDILRRPWDELNGHSVIDRTNMDKRTFNSFVDESVDDPNEAWKWRGTRSLARNKAMAMHAYMTQEYIIPAIFAQNDNQEEDQAVSEVMHDLVEYLTINSNYRQSFMGVALGMLVNPVTYLEASWNEVFQTIKEKSEGGYSKQEILDEVLSGFKANVLGPDQVLITNAYEPNIQRQRSICKVHYREYTELKQQYGDHPNWTYVQPGMLNVFNSDDGLFYETKDDTHPFWVQETTYMSRTDDTEVCFLGGIYMGNDNVEWNPMRHRDNRGAPKYNITPFGYEPISEHFAFFKSLMFRVGWDNKLLDAMYEVTMNREFLDLEMPVAVSGAEQVDTSVVFPGAQISSLNPNFKVTPIIPPRGTNPYAALREIEGSMEESSISKTQTGALPEASQKAYTVAQAAQAARTILGAVGKTLGESIRQYGDLMVDIVINHMTTPQVDEISGNSSYRKFILQDKMMDGKKVSKEIRFDDELMGRPMTKGQHRQYAMKMLEESGYPDNKKAIVVLNPFLFSKMKYFTRIEPDQMSPKSKYLEQVLMERLYSLLLNNPNVDLAELTRELVNEFKPGAAGKLMAKQTANSNMAGGQGLEGLMQQIQKKNAASSFAKSSPLPTSAPA